ncbi:hypothetical protein PYW07_002714 [Mythimna separata]|uniref:Protein prenyltransferase alpha subunit repeat-containing protein 1 n=1 Tax=Mythimna separata TaxID=271217 RepID=A0AAD8DQ50_MYTSE|nr:hypothetical protein PYW07_002714 [Mythimna separata]
MSISEEDRVALTGLVEKIIKELNQYLEDRELTEFDIIGVESTTNRSPVLYIQTSLGLESWCVKHVYNYCYAELIRDFLTNPKRRFSRLSNLNYKRIISLLNPTLLINPDVTSLWNKRREMTSQQFHDWFSEMHFTKLVLTRKPKCNEAYSYRRWILSNILAKDDVLSEEFLNDVIAEELRVCNKAADKCMNNYHSWDHRAFLIDLSWRYRFSFDSTMLYFKEYKFIRHWTSTHVSDYSCFHYRQICVRILFLIEERWPVFEKMIDVNLRDNFQKILSDHMTSDDPVATPSKISKKTMDDDDLTALVLGYPAGNCKCYATWKATLRKLELLFYELISNEDLLKYYPNHQTIWYQRRFVVNNILNAMYNYLSVENKYNGTIKQLPLSPLDIERKNNCTKCADADLTEHHNNVKKQKEDWFWNCPLYKVLIRHELALIKDRRKEDSKYAEAHENYLKFFEGLFLNFNP